MTYEITMYNSALDVHVVVKHMFLDYALRDAAKLKKLDFKLSFGYINIPEDQRSATTPSGVWYEADSLEELGGKMQEFRL